LCTFLSACLFICVSDRIPAFSFHSPPSPAFSRLSPITPHHYHLSSHSCYLSSHSH
jgi:hypothetical protein